MLSNYLHYTYQRQTWIQNVHTKNIYLPYTTFSIEMLSLLNDNPPPPQHTHPQAQHSTTPANH